MPAAHFPILLSCVANWGRYFREPPVACAPDIRVRPAIRYPWSIEPEVCQLVEYHNPRSHIPRGESESELVTGTSVDGRPLYYGAGRSRRGRNWVDGVAVLGTDEPVGPKPHLAKVRVAGSNPVFCSKNVMSRDIEGRVLPITAVDSMTSAGLAGSELRRLRWVDRAEG